VPLPVISVADEPLEVTVTNPTEPQYQARPASWSKDTSGAEAWVSPIEYNADTWLEIFVGTGSGTPTNIHPVGWPARAVIPWAHGQSDAGDLSVRCDGAVSVLLQPPAGRVAIIPDGANRLRFCMSRTWAPVP
jgi:hypothetical protein